MTLLTKTIFNEVKHIARTLGKIVIANCHNETIGNLDKIQALDYPLLPPPFKETK